MKDDQELEDEDPAFVTWTAHHSVQFALINAVAFALVGVAATGRLIGLVGGLVAGLIQWLIWRPGGPGLRWNRKIRAAEKRRST